MRATVLTEVVDKKSGKVLKRVVQPSRSFTEGLMHCLYVAQSQGFTEEPRAIGYQGASASIAQQLYQNTSFDGLRVTQGEANHARKSLFVSSFGGGTANHATHVPMGIIFGEGNAAVSSYDRSLEKPIGINFPVPVSLARLDTLMEANVYGCFDAVTDQWYFINHGTNPNKIYRFNADGVWQSTLNTNIVSTSSGYLCAFALGGFLYAYRSSPRLLYKIDLVTGLNVLQRDIGAEIGGGNHVHSIWYDSTAGNIVGIGNAGGGVVNLARWNLADFTLAVAAAPINFNRSNGAVAQTVERATAIDAAGNFAFGKVGLFWSLIDVVNLICYPWSTFASTHGIPDLFASGLDSVGWWRFAHAGTAAVLMKQHKIRTDPRNLRLLPTYCNLVESDAVSGYFDIVGSMENNTAAAINIAEVGIHAWSGPANSPLIARDVLAIPVAVPAGQVIRTTYRLSASI